MKELAFDLEERLISHAVRVIRLAEALPATAVGNHVRVQILRCGTSPGPNYAEAQAAESRADFIHKLKIVLKELREVRVWLRMILKAGLVKPSTILEPLIQETEELVAIFTKSLKTASGKRS